MPQNIEHTPLTSWNPKRKVPSIDDTAYIHPQAIVIGDVNIGKRVMVSPFVSIRGDEGGPIHIDDDSNVQDGVIMHGMKTIDSNGDPIEANQTNVEGIPYSVYVGKRVSMAHQSQVHGPAAVFDDVFLAMQTLVFKATVGKGSVLEPKSAAFCVDIPENRYVPAGMVITKQEDADALPEIFEGYIFKTTNREVVDVNIELAKGYLEKNEK